MASQVPRLDPPLAWTVLAAIAQEMHQDGLYQPAKPAPWAVKKEKLPAIISCSSRTWVCIVQGMMGGRRSTADIQFVIVCEEEDPDEYHVELE